jgi:sucrose-6-phosphate hydrolase SacC (GH32 family)
MANMKDDDGTDLNLREELYCAWPEVVVKIDEINAAQSGFFMYYSTMTKDDKEKSIGYAVSLDGFRWEKRGICLRPEEGSMDAGGCARCNVFLNAEFDEETSTWKDAEGYKMLYEGASKEDNKHRIMMAESSDGRKWTKSGVVLNVGADGAWDCEGVGSPDVIR